MKTKPPQKTYQPTRAEIVAWEKRQTTKTEASAEPFPGPLRDAFASLPTTLLGLNLLPITAGHIAILEAINSPFLASLKLAGRILRCEDKKRKKQLLQQAQHTKLTIPDLAETLFVFTRNPRDLWAILGRDDRAASSSSIRREATNLLETLPPIPDWDDIQNALAAHYSKSFLTAIEYQRKADDDSNFTHRSHKTASAGSST